jgi:hypothetical protein
MGISWLIPFLIRSGRRDFTILPGFPILLWRPQFRMPENKLKGRTVFDGVNAIVMRFGYGGLELGECPEKTTGSKTQPLFGDKCL